MKVIFIFSILLVSSSVVADEQEIKYLGSNGLEEKHELICSNGQSGIVTINISTKKMYVQVHSSNIKVDLGEVTFREAEEAICES